MNEHAPLHVLLLEDNPADARMVDILLTEGPCDAYQLSHFESLKDALTGLNHQDFDIALLDLNLPDAAGPEVFEAVHAQKADLPIVILTGQKDEEFGRMMVRAGAQSYLDKGSISSDLLYWTLMHSIERQHLSFELRGKQLEAEKAELRLKTLVYNIHEAILIVKQSTKPLLVNPAAENLLSVHGFHADSLTSENFYGHSLQEERSFEISLENKIFVAAVEEIDWDGDESFVVTIRDVTQRRRLEDEFRANLEVQVKERTEKLDKMVKLMAGRELRMAELKNENAKLRSQSSYDEKTAKADRSTNERRAG